MLTFVNNELFYFQDHFFAKFLGIKQEENSDFTFVYWS